MTTDSVTAPTWFRRLGGWIQSQPAKLADGLLIKILWIVAAAVVGGTTLVASVRDWFDHRRVWIVLLASVGTLALGWLIIWETHRMRTRRRGFAAQVEGLKVSLADAEAELAQEQSGSEDARVLVLNMLEWLQRETLDDGPLEEFVRHGNKLKAARHAVRCSGRDSLPLSRRADRSRTAVILGVDSGQRLL